MFISRRRCDTAYAVVALHADDGDQSAIPANATSSVAW
jgi:hypothetical protein